MSNENFIYEEYEEVRLNLVKTIHKSLTIKDKQFRLSVKRFEPDWNIYNFEPFPAIKWKLQNLQNKNPDKHNELYKQLMIKLNSII